MATPPGMVSGALRAGVSLFSRRNGILLSSKWMGLGELCAKSKGEEIAANTRLKTDRQGRLRERIGQIIKGWPEPPLLDSTLKGTWVRNIPASTVAAIDSSERSLPTAWFRFEQRLLRIRY